MPVSPVSKTFKRLSKLSDSKARAYGPQQALVKSIFSTLLKKKPIVIKTGDDAWRFHLLMEVLAKNLRTINLYINGDGINEFESLVDSLEDGSVYNVLLANELRRSK